MYTIEQFHEEVLQEAKNIKQHATPEEISRLDFETLDPTKLKSCIYGQMTGNCDSYRGIELIEKCAIRFVRDSSISYIRIEGFERIQEHISGATVHDLYNKRPSRFDRGDVSHYSTIESYIFLPYANNAGLIAFIKGEAETVEL